MNRRSFLKSITTVCGAAVVCPGELLKSPVECTATKCYREYLGQNRCHNCLWNINDIPTTKLILRKQDPRFPHPYPNWLELVEVSIDYQGEEIKWPE